MLYQDEAHNEVPPFTIAVEVDVTVTMVVVDTGGAVSVFVAGPWGYLEAQKERAAGTAETSEAMRPPIPVQTAAERVKDVEKKRRLQSSGDIRTTNIRDGLWKSRTTLGRC